MIKIGPIQKKILLMLLGGFVLGASRNPKQYWKVVGALKYEWKKIDRQSLERAINALYESKLISEKTNNDGSVTMILNSNGKRKALTYNLETIEIKKPEKWDGKWRVVVSDVPEKLRKMRSSLRFHLYKLGFYPLQKSVFVHPYECQKEIEFITEWYRGRKFVRFITAEKIDNELEIKKYFNLI